MKIFRPKITQEGAEVRVSARVEVNTSKTELSQELWFIFPSSCRDNVTDHLNGFVVALLPLAMTLEEDMQMEGVLSPRLLRGLEEYQSIQCAWKPTSFKPIKIESDLLQPTERDRSEPVVGCSFSGGVDSSFTLWRHLPENERDHAWRISHCLMINGFDSDSDINNSGHFNRIQQALEPMMDHLGLQLIVCRTNYMSFSDPYILKQSFGAMVTSPALILGRLFSSLFIPASYRFDEFFRDGSHLLFDHLLRTETMEIIHDASHLTRPEKTAIISKWSDTYTTLRVCFNKTSYREETNSIENCCKCEKCIRTMKSLEMYGGLEKYKTFPRRPSHLDVWMCYYGYKGVRIHAKEIISQALKVGRADIVIDYCIAIVKSMIIKIPRELIGRLHLTVVEWSEAHATPISRLLPRLRRRVRRIK
jgi:hypothetical protein